ncbi:protein-tyrosine-phosphatase MKP1-like [Aristolochia californica]|uniref:protein-tyrosine-phosphatase MKP1-like n=1 Tax=Aristolochia californica TaxID=171875 RepID=UPI0035D99E1C
MVGDEDPTGSRGPCPLPSGRRTFWRSNSWSSRSPSSEQINDFRDLTDPSSTQFRQDRHFPVPLTPRSHKNPKGRSCLPPLQPLSITRRNLDEWPKAGSDDIGEWPHPPTPSGSSNRGLKLDLSSFQQKPDPTGTLVKKDKIAFFDKECSKVAEHIYLGGDAVARDRGILIKNGITHVLNCVGFVSPEYFKADFVYKTLWLQDSPSEDITSILYDVFDYFEDVREQRGRVLVHCCQGVSRSTSLVIAYLMWREGQSFEDAFQYVKAARGIADPNMGFTCQLLQCQKRVHAIPLSPSSILRMYRMAPHSSYDALHLVPKMLNDASPSALDSRGAFIVHVPSAIYVWIGKNCESAMERDAKAAAFQVVRYERAQGPIITVEEGEEPSDFWNVFSNCSHSVDNSDTSLQVEKEQIESTVRVGVGRKRVDLYDVDFELFHKALMGGIVPPFSSTSGAVHEMRVPARESNWSILRRKFGPGVVKEWLSAPRATLSRVYSDSMLMVDTENPVNKIQLLSRYSSVSSDSSVNPKPPSSDSASLLSSAASLSATPSPASTAACDSTSSSSHTMLPKQDPCNVPCSDVFSSPSKDHFHSFFECYGGLLSSGTLIDASSSSLSCSDHSVGRNEDSKKNRVELLDYIKENTNDDDVSVTTDEVGGSLLREKQQLSTVIDSINTSSDFSNPMNLLIYCWPNLKKIAKFCVGDFDSKAVFLFLAPEKGVGKKLYLWIGSCFEHQNRLTQIDRCRDENKGIDWNQVGCDFLTTMGLPKDIPIKVVREEEGKPKDFLEMLNAF